MPVLNNDAQFEVIARCIRAISCPDRLSILHVLLNGEQSVNNIAFAVSCSQPRTSVSLHQLTVSRLVKSTKIANQVFYGIADKRIHNIISMLETQFATD